MEGQPGIRSSEEWGRWGVWIDREERARCVEGGIPAGRESCLAGSGAGNRIKGLNSFL